MRAPLAAIATAFVLVAVISTLPLGSPASSQAAFVFWVIILWCGLRLIHVMTLREFRPLDFFFLVFVIVWGGLAPLSQLSTGINPWLTDYSNAEWTVGAELIAFAVLSYELGRLFGRGRARPTFTSRLRLNYVAEPRVVFEWVAVAVGALFVAIVGDPRVFVSTRGELDAALSSAFEADQALPVLFSGIASTLVLLALMLRIRGRNSKSNPPVRQTGRLRLGILIILFILLANPLSSSRYWFGSAAGALAILYVVGRRGASIRSIAVVALLTLTVMFPYLDKFRYAEVDRGRAGASSESTGISSQYTTKLDYDAMQQTLDGLRQVEAEGLTFGKQLAGTVLFFAPRSIWASKPNPTGVSIGEYMNRPSTNLSSPLWIEAYFDFGFPGVFLTFFLVGWLWVHLDGRLANSNDVIGQTLGVFLSLYQLILLRGSLQATVGRLAIFVAVLVWMSRASDRSSRPQRN